MKVKKDNPITLVETDIEGEFLEEFNSNKDVLRRIVFEDEGANLSCDWDVPVGMVIGVNCFTDWYKRKGVVLYRGENEFFRKYHVNDVKVEVKSGKHHFSKLITYTLDKCKLKLIILINTYSTEGNVVVDEVEFQEEMCDSMGIAPEVTVSSFDYDSIPDDFDKHIE